VWTLLALVAVVVSYLLNLLIGVLCIIVPLLVLPRSGLWGFLLLLFGGVAGITILWSSVPRRQKFKPPGVLLDLARHPKLAAEIESVATALAEPMPREVYLVLVPNAFVAESGGHGRILGLGLPLLGALTVSEFRAVLAHEFAHYYSGDTRLGPWLYSARASMVRVLTNLHTGGASAFLRALTAFVVIRIAYLGVFGAMRLYGKALLRVTNFLSRRQEYRCDELACHIGGSTAFIKALQSIHVASIAFAPFWKSEIEPAVAAGFCPPLADGFARFLNAPSIKKQTGGKLEQAMSEPRENEFDTHPPLAERIRRASGIHGFEGPREEGMAATLLEDPGQVEAQLIGFAAPAVKVSALRKMDWDTAASDVYAPLWQAAVTPHLDSLGKGSIGELPELVLAFQKNGPRIPDPPGMLLTRKQREDRTASILWMALSLALIKAGWVLHMQPGQRWIGRENQRLDPVALISGLRFGTTTPEQWRKLCEGLGISKIPMASDLDWT
jgi:Zn-dependent protease with chaperone function